MFPIVAELFNKELRCIEGSIIFPAHVVCVCVCSSSQLQKETTKRHILIKANNFLHLQANSRLQEEEEKNQSHPRKAQLISSVCE